MNSTELYERFRSDVVDVAKPYLWSDDEVWGYMNDAYHMFVRLIGGIWDFDSEASSVAVVAGEANAVLHPSIMRIVSASRRSDSVAIEVINSTDVGKLRSLDYGQIKKLSLDNRAGPVRYMMIGARKGIARWIQVPEVDDTVDMMIYRLPLVTITGDGQAMDEVEDDHHLHFLDWMKHLAYKKQDAETFDKAKSDLCKADFYEYCTFVKGELARYKHKTRVVSYGGY